MAADDEALSDLPPIFKQLSPRQLDVAKLVGKGQTNWVRLFMWVRRKTWDT